MFASSKWRAARRQPAGGSPDRRADAAPLAKAAFCAVSYSFSRLHDFGFFLLRHFFDPLLELLEQRLDFLLALVALVLGHFLALLGLVEVLVAVAADVAAG